VSNTEHIKVNREHIKVNREHIKENREHIKVCQTCVSKMFRNEKVDKGNICAKFLSMNEDLVLRELLNYTHITEIRIIRK
jgi:hypothetical protein